MEVGAQLILHIDYGNILCSMTKFERGTGLIVLIVSKVFPNVILNVFEVLSVEEALSFQLPCVRRKHQLDVLHHHSPLDEELEQLPAPDHRLRVQLLHHVAQGFGRHRPS